MNIESANTQHPVPQNVMDVEFKLIGDLTIRQFSYLLIFGVLVFIVYNIHLPFIFSYPIMGVLILAGVGFAFIPLNDISLDKWAFNYYRAITSPRIRVWKHKDRIPYYFQLDPKLLSKSSKDYGVKITTGSTKKMSLDDLLKSTDTKSKVTVDFEDESDLLQKEKDFLTKIGFKDRVEDTPQIGRTSVIEDGQEMKQNFVNISNSQNNAAVTKESIQNISYQKEVNELNKIKEKAEKQLEKAEKVKPIKKEIETKNVMEEKIQLELSENAKKINIGVGNNKILEETVKEEKKEVETTDKLPQVETEKKDKGPKTSLFKNLFEMLLPKKQEEVEIKEEKENNLVGVLNTDADAEKIRERIKKQKGNKIDFILNGQTVDETGKMIPSVVVIVKNRNQEPIRAMKSNSLGIFDSTTPLKIDEVYTIDGIKDNFSFDTVTLKTSSNGNNLVKLIGKPTA